MEIFNNKFLVKLIASVCLVLALFNVAGTSTVYASGDDDEYVLLKPIVHLLTAIGDGIVNLMHRVVLEQKDTLITLKGYTGWEAFWRGIGVILVTVVAIVVVAAIAYFTAGAGAVIAAKIAGTAFTVTAAMVNAALLGRSCRGSYSWCCCLILIF